MLDNTTALQSVLMQCASIAATIARRGRRDQMLDMIAGTRPFEWNEKFSTTWVDDHRNQCDKESTKRKRRNETNV